jgi:YhcH/YjgK/YiaL family protein
MIVDIFENTPLYNTISPRFAEAFQFMKATDFSKLEDGIHEIDGKNIFASINSYRTKNYGECKWEAHEIYADIQFLQKGKERIYYSPLKNSKIIEVYDQKKDILFVETVGDYATVVPGVFVILFPTDAHKPCIFADIQEEVRKVVIKVKLQ